MVIHCLTCDQGHIYCTPVYANRLRLWCSQCDYSALIWVRDLWKPRLSQRHKTLRTYYPKDLIADFQARCS